MQPTDTETFRQFPVHDRLGNFLTEENISYSRVGLVAMSIKVPCSERVRMRLLEALRDDSIEFISPASLKDIRTRRWKLSDRDQELFEQGLELMGHTADQFFDCKVSSVYLSFAMFCCAVLPAEKWNEMKWGLRQTFTCPVTASAISDWINGHRKMSGESPTLLLMALRVLRPGCFPNGIPHPTADPDYIEGRSYRLNPDQVQEIKSRLSSGENPIEIAKAYGVVKGTIYAIKTGQTWKNLSPKVN